MPGPGANERAVFTAVAPAALLRSVDELHFDVGVLRVDRHAE